MRDKGQLKFMKSQMLPFAAKPAVGKTPILML